MCKKMTVAYGDFIGQRMVGWCLFNGKDYSFLSDRQIKARLESGDLVNGLKLDEEGKVTINREFAPYLMGKSGLTFSPIMGGDEDEAPAVNKYYALVNVEKDKGRSKYHFITNRCGLEVMDEAQVKAMLAIMALGGVRLDSKGKVVVYKGVELEEATEAASKATEAAAKTTEKGEGG